jgi:S-adenosylmethionine synthetase
MLNKGPRAGVGAGAAPSFDPAPVGAVRTKNVVAAGLAEECLVQLGYCIDLVDPVSVMVNTYGTGKLSEEALSILVRKVFPLSPKCIIDHLKLRNPVYLKTAAYGHFGRPDSRGNTRMRSMNYW